MPETPITDGMTDTALDAHARAILRPPERVGICDWAEKHIRLPPKITAFPGPLRLDLTPYVRGVLEAFRDPAIETIYLSFGAQTAKTTSMLLTLFYAIHMDPGPALWIMPAEDLARSFSQNRVQPIIDETPVLCAEKPVNLDRYKSLEYQLRRMTVAFIGSNSPADLSSRPIRYLWMDEVDKFPTESFREGSPVRLGMRRTSSFWNRKVIISSTPSLQDGPIWRGLLSGDWREYNVPCPHCGQMQPLRFANIRRPPEAPLEAIPGLAWYECAGCGGHITDAHKPAMLLSGQWVPRPDRIPEYDWSPPSASGKIASFHLPSWYAPTVRFGDVLARFLAAQPYPEELREVINSDLAEPWRGGTAERKETDILKHRSEYAPGTVPSDAHVAAVFCTSDVQAQRMFYTVRAWGEHEESWLIEYGMLPDVSSLAAVASRRYGPHAINLTFVDSGFDTDRVYEFCRTHPGCIPIKGMEQIRTIINWSTVDRSPNGQIIAGGIKLLGIRAAQWRESLMVKLNIQRGDPGYWHLHAEAGEDYARQICAEILVERKDRQNRIHREWKLVRRDNHYLDCEVYQLAAAYAMGVRYATAPAPNREAPSRPAGPDWIGRQNWSGKKKGWL